MTTQFKLILAVIKEMYFTDDGLWKVLAKISVSNVNSCCMFTLTLLTLSKNV